MAENERDALLTELERVREKLDKHQTLFDLAVDGDEIEALIYEYKALSLRYSRLWRRAKELKQEIK